MTVTVHRAKHLTEPSSLGIAQAAYQDSEGCVRCLFRLHSSEEREAAFHAVVKLCQLAFAPLLLENDGIFTLPATSDSAQFLQALLQVVTEAVRSQASVRRGNQLS